MRSFQVEVSWDGQVVPDVMSVSPLRTITDVITYRDGGGGVYKLPGRVDTVAAMLRRGVSSDLAFDVWAKTPELKKDVRLRFTDASDALAVVYLLHGCWVCEYDVALDTDSGALVESITVSVNRWERVTPPSDEVAQEWATQRGVGVRRVGLAPLLTGRLEETEKRLAELLSEADSFGSILLFDEAEALFANRTNVQDAHDRYQATELDVVMDELARSNRAVLFTDPGDPPTT